MRGLDFFFDRIKGLVCERYGIGEDELYKSKRGVFNEPKNVAIYLIRVLRCEGLEEIGRDFDMTRYSSVSSVIERVKNQILKDRKFKKRLDAFLAELTKGQTKTPTHESSINSLFLTPPLSALVAI